jgi:hypothetical protein
LVQSSERQMVEMITAATSPKLREHYIYSQMVRHPSAIELDLPASEVEELIQEFWALKQLHELLFLYDEIKSYLPSFLRLFQLMSQNKMLSEEDIVKLLRYAGHELPVLETKIQKLTGDVIDLEWKKKDLNNTITLWNAQLSDLGRTIVQYQKAIDSKKQQLMRMDKRIS